MRYLKLLLLLFILFSSSQLAYSQCCAAGNPDSGDDPSEGGGKNKLTVALGFRYSYSDQYYNGTEPVEFKYIDYSYFDFTSLTLSYGITKKLRVAADIGYFFAKTNTYIHIPEKEAVGLGDASLLLTYKLIQTKKYHFAFTPIIKVTFPVGQFDRIYEGVVLPIDLQPSSGSFRYAGGLIINKRFGESKFSMNSILNMEISQWIDTDRTKYKYGNLYNISLAGNYAIFKNLGFRLQARYQIRERATGSNDELINATGGQVIFLSPQINYTFFKSWKIGVVYDQPIYKNMNGLQLTNKYMISAKLSKTFDFNKSDTTGFAVNMPENYEVTTKKISGTCGACKMTIEKICYAQKGVYYANWEVETQILTLKHSEKMNMDKLLKKLAKEDHKVIP